MKTLGYYAKDNENNLHQFEWSTGEDAHKEILYIITPLGRVEVDKNDYDIVQVGQITSEDFNKPTSGYSSIEMYNNVLVHVSRTWERIRMNQVDQTMPIDNIQSIDVIVAIATQIFDGDVIQGFVNGSEEVRMNDYWIKNTEEGMSDIYIEDLADKIIIEEYIEAKAPKSKVREWEQINDGVELNEDFLPNQNLTYTIEFDGIDRFRASLEQLNFDRNLVGVEAAPKTIIYKLDKAVEDFNDEEKQQVLSYRGLTLDDGFGVDDIFIEKSYITLHSIPFKVTMDVEHSTTFDEGESAEDFLKRTADVYLHSAGEEGYREKDDLGGNTKIEFI